MLLLTLIMSQSLRAEELDTVYIKNSGDAVVNVCIGGSYQGRVPVGRTRYTTRLGFVTQDSGRQPNGTMKVEESHAGWEGHGDRPIFCWTVKDGRVASWWRGTLPGDQKYVLVVFGGDELPDELEVENSSPVDKGNADCRVVEAEIKKPLEAFNGTYISEKYTLTLNRIGNRVSGKIQRAGRDYSVFGDVRDGTLNLTINVDGSMSTLTVTGNGQECTLDDNRKQVRLVNNRLIKESIGKVGRKPGTGDVQVTLRWTGGPDVDLHVVDPSGDEIYFEKRKSSTGGEIDIDDTDGIGPENIFWPAGQAPAGKYIVRVNLYAGQIASWKVRILVDGKSQAYAGNLVGTGATQEVATFVREARPKK